MSSVHIQTTGKLSFEGCHIGNGIRDVLDALADSPVLKVSGLVFAGFLMVTLAIGITQNIFKWVDAEPPGLPPRSWLPFM